MWILALALVFGPPKLPPLPGRGMPAPSAPSQPDAAAPSEGPARRPPPPSASEAEAPAPAPKPASAAPTSKAPSAPASKTPSAPATKAPAAPASNPPDTRPPPPPPPSRPGDPSTAVALVPVSGVATGAQPGLRLVGAEELAQWEREGQAPTSSPAPPSKHKREAVVLRSARQAPLPERLVFRRRPTPPERTAAFVLGYRYFRIQDQLGRAQDWHLASLEVTPVRRYMRVNLLTEFGIESGPAARSGGRADIMLMQRLGLGMQYPGFVTPLIEFQGGVGAARVELFERNDLALVYTLGLDGGVQWAVTRWMYVHAALGWIRPTFTVGSRSSSFDRLAVKLGIGF